MVNPGEVVTLAENGAGPVEASGDATLNTRIVVPENTTSTFQLWHDVSGQFANMGALEQYGDLLFLPLYDVWMTAVITLLD